MVVDKIQKCKRQCVLNPQPTPFSSRPSMYVHRLVSNQLLSLLDLCCMFTTSHPMTSSGSPHYFLLISIHIPHTSHIKPSSQQGSSDHG